MKLRTFVMATAATALLAPLAALSATAAPTLANTVDTFDTGSAVTVQLDPFATALRDGSLRVSGTYSCFAPDSPVNMIVGTVTQTVGRTKVTGGFATEEITCDGAEHTFSLVARTENGLFAGGKVSIDSAIWTCSDFGCDGVTVHDDIQARRGN